MFPNAREASIHFFNTFKTKKQNFDFPYLNIFLLPLIFLFRTLLFLLIIIPSLSSPPSASPPSASAPATAATRSRTTATTRAPGSPTGHLWYLEREKCSFHREENIFFFWKLWRNRPTRVRYISLESINMVWLHKQLHTWYWTIWRKEVSCVCMDSVILIIFTHVEAT